MGSLKDSTATDCDPLTSSVTSTQSSALLMLKQQQPSLSDDDDKNLAAASRTVSVDDNADVAIIAGEDISIGHPIPNQATIIKRYKMERKNSQQSHSKVVL